MTERDIYQGLVDGIATEVAKFLTLKSFTLEDLSEQTGFSRGYVRKILASEANLTLMEVAVLARVMGKKARVIWWEDSREPALP